MCKSLNSASCLQIFLLQQILVPFSPTPNISSLGSVSVGGRYKRESKRTALEERMGF